MQAGKWHNLTHSRLGSGTLGLRLGLGGAIGLYSFISLLSLNALLLWFPPPSPPHVKNIAELDRENSVPEIESVLNQLLEGLGSATRFDLREWYGRWTVILNDREWFAFLGHRLTHDEVERIQTAVNHGPAAKEEEMDEENHQYND